MNIEYWKALQRIVEKSKIIIDRPKGSYHPNGKDIIYEIDYGYLENTSSMDNGGIDVWVGTLQGTQITGICVTVDELKNDSEIKVLIDCTNKEMETIEKFHNQGHMKGILIKNEARDNK